MTGEKDDNPVNIQHKVNIRTFQWAMGLWQTKSVLWDRENGIHPTLVQVSKGLCLTKRHSVEVWMRRRSSHMKQLREKCSWKGNSRKARCGKMLVVFKDRKIEWLKQSKQFEGWNKLRSERKSNDDEDIIHFRKLKNKNIFWACILNGYKIKVSAHLLNIYMISTRKSHYLLIISHLTISYEEHTIVKSIRLLDILT